MHTLRVLAKPAEHEPPADIELDASVCDEIAELVTEVRRALAEHRYASLGLLAHPLAIRREHARLSRLLGAEISASFWTRSTAHVEAVRLVGEGTAEVYEYVRHHPSATSMRLMGTVEHIKGRWRLIDVREAWDERITAVLLRGAPPEEPLDVRAWTARWDLQHGPTATLRLEGGRGVLEHPEERWTAVVRTGSGQDLSRVLAFSGAQSELLEKQPAATVLSLIPSLNAHKRTEQLRWLSHAVAAFGERDASSVWLPASAKALPFVTWKSAVDGPLELPALSALWLRTQRMPGTWVTRGLTTFMLPEVEVSSIGMMPATVRSLMRMSVGRLLRHHAERSALRIDGSAAAVPAVAPRLYRRTAEGPIPQPTVELESALEIGTTFQVGEVEARLAPGRPGPRQGESYGRWGSVSLRSDPAWWLGAA